MKLKLLISILSFISSGFNRALACNRRPQGASGDQSAVDDNFQITIEGNPATYIPGQIYNVTLSCAINFKFISFTLVAETEPGTPPGYDLTGHFEIIDTAETRFSTQCENMIENSNTNIKNRIDVAWVAPTNPNSTCVYIKAAVLQHRNVWFMDDGFLTKRICAEEIDDVNSQTPLVNPCCACDEAKYELILERRWTRNTHSKNYPKEDWRTRFSEVVGASHTYDYRFWTYGSHASLGLKELAEHGAAKTLENEIKEHSESGSIRTIIKAPPIPFRKNVMGSTLATVRVDPRHHMVSFVTKIIPSPDWILGVAGLELCLANCTWIDQKVLNLFPWDVGTDAGPSYMSPDQQQVPADVIRRISSTYPSDYRSPFYDETGAAMKPMATLYIKRKKLYERECEPDDNVPFECTTHPWVDWSECSTKCGPGTQYRIRAYKDPNLAARFNCEVVLRQTQRCVGTQCGLQEEDGNEATQNAECALTPWTQWSPCSKSCGRGYTKRTRDYRNPYARDSCQAALHYDLEQTNGCSGNACGGTIPSYNNGGFNQFEHEPGLMEENSYDQPLYPTQRGRGSYIDRGNVRWDTSNRPPNGPKLFGNINPNSFNNDNMDSQQTELNYPRSNLNYFNSNRSPNRNADDEDNFTWIGSSKQNTPISKYDQEFEEGDNTENNNSDQRWLNNNPSNLFDSENNFLYNNNKNDNNKNNEESNYNNFDRNNENEFVENREMTPALYPFYKEEYEPITTDRTFSRFQSPGFHSSKKDRQSKYRTGQGTDPFTDSRGNTELGEIYDDNGQKTLMAAGTNPDEYTVVQEYCFQKPHVVRRRCPGKKIISNYWFYDADDRQCKLFTTDNCDENKNKFRTIDACEGTCLQPILNLEEQQMRQQRRDRNGWPEQFGEPLSQTRSYKRVKTQVLERSNQRNGNRNLSRFGRF